MSSIEQLLATWTVEPETASRIEHIERVAERAGLTAPLHPPPPPEVAEHLARLGIEQLYRHQVAAIGHVRDGRNTVVVAGTASGKSLAYQLPIAETIAEDATAAALLIFPTKALTQDQLRSLQQLGTPSLVAATYDGDTATDDRRWVRRNANVILTNPDMLHVGILPHHGSWKRVLERLEFVVIDELHTLRGIFGSHVALIVRRLRRLAAHYGSDPRFIFTSATIGNPGGLAAMIMGDEVTVVDQDTSPGGRKTYVLWNPELEDPERGVRASPLTDATRVFTDLVASDLHTIVFSRSRKASELMYRWARDRLDPERADRIAPYRGGYLAEDRRRIEHELFTGQLLGVTATNALELGIDVGGLDAAVITTFPGTIASFRQQAGRAGRSQADSLAVLVAGQDALDQYYMHHPGQLFTRSAESVVVNPDNPEIFEVHARCAAHEVPLVPDDRTWLGEQLEEAAARLVARGDLGLRNGRLFFRGGRSPAFDIDIRSSGGRPYDIVDDDGRLMGSVDESRAFSQCHDGAVYLHQGDAFIVDRLDLDDRVVRVRPGEAGYYTQPKIDKDLSIVEEHASAPVGRLRVHHGMVDVESVVVGYQRKSIRSGDVLETVPLDLPPQRLRTMAFWYTFPDILLAELDLGWNELPGILHAAEHTAISILPVFAVCDRWDVGGLSTAFHPATRGAVFFIYDGYAGGAGIAPIGYASAARHLGATLDALDRCPCVAGCPSCVQSPKCGNFNEPLDKDGAAALLRSALAVR